MSWSKKRERNSMKIDGIEVMYLSEWDGKPVKNHLSVGLRSRMMTKLQWMTKGYRIKPDVNGYGMHPSAMSKSWLPIIWIRT